MRLLKSSSKDGGFYFNVLFWNFICINFDGKLKVIMDKFLMALSILKSGKLKNTSHITTGLEWAPFEMNGCRYYIIGFCFNESEFINETDLSPDLICQYMDLNGNKYHENIMKLLTRAIYLDPFTRLTHSSQ